MEKLVKLLCCLVPVKRWRKAIRETLVENKKKHKKRLAGLKRCGDFQIKEIEGVQVACGNGLKLGYVFEGDGMVVVEEVFGNGEYHFDLGADAVVIDIGMNIGMASLYFASRDDVTCVYGFEPFKPTFDQALFNFKINEGFAGKIHPFHYGLGDREKELTFEYYSRAPGQMSTVKHIGETHPWRKDETESETVQIREAATELSAIIDRHKDKKIIIKCDTEGSEKEIFESLAAKDLLKSVDMIMLEYHFSYDQPILEILKKNDFALFKQKIITLETGDFGMIRAVKM